MNDKITYRIYCLPEDIPVRGNAIASGADKADQEVEDTILADLERGNEWAWCTVKLTASYGGLTGVDYLGACSYASEDDFRQDGYYEDMKAAATSDLLAQLKAASIAYDDLNTREVVT